LNIQSNMAIGFTRWDKDLKSKTSLIFGLSHQSPFYDKNDYAQKQHNRYIERLSQMAFFESDIRYSIALVRENPKWVIQLQFTEDWTAKSGFGMDGLNHEDFQVHIRFTRKF